MATLGGLVQAGALQKVEVPLEPGDNVQRLVFGAPPFVRFCAEQLPTLTTGAIGEDSTPAEQVDSILHAYITGETIHYDRQLKCLQPHSDGIVELKTTDVRIFGFVPQKAMFIALCAASKDNIVAANLYPVFMRECRRMRAELGFQPGECVTGENSDDYI